MGPEGKARTIYTIGSSTRGFQEFLDLLLSYKIVTLVDVRIFPYSKRFQHFIRESLEENIPSAGLHYIYLGRELGGYRTGGYEVYMQTTDFTKGVEALEAIGREGRAAFMCCERLPWKCHRRFIGSELQRRGWQVIHIIDKDRIWQPQHSSRFTVHGSR
ncbi:MAG: DUF488 family protein [Candidatus Methylomirabilales bacterium]